MRLRILFCHCFPRNAVMLLELYNFLLIWKICKTRLYIGARCMVSMSYWYVCVQPLTHGIFSSGDCSFFLCEVVGFLCVGAFCVGLLLNTGLRCLFVLLCICAVGAFLWVILYGYYGLEKMNNGSNDKTFKLAEDGDDTSCCVHPSGCVDRLQYVLCLAS